MDGALRRLRRFGLAARPDQVVCAVLAFDEAGIDRCRERRIVEGHGDVSPPGFAGLLPRRADVVAGRLKAEVGGRSEEHTSELQSLMRISYAVFCLKHNRPRILLKNCELTIK